MWYALFSLKVLWLLDAASLRNGSTGFADMPRLNLRRRQTLLTLLAFLPLVAALLNGVLFSYRSVAQRGQNYMAGLAQARQAGLVSWAENMEHALALVQADWEREGATADGLLLESWLRVLRAEYPSVQGLALIDRFGSAVQQAGTVFLDAIALEDAQARPATSQKGQATVHLVQADDGRAGLLLTFGVDAERFLVVQFDAKVLWRALLLENQPGPKRLASANTYLLTKSGLALRFDPAEPDGVEVLSWTPPPADALVEVDPEGHDVVGAVRWLPNQPVGVMVTLSREALTTGPERIWTYMVLGILILAGLSVLGVWRISNQITAGVERLTQATRRMQKGDFAQHVDVDDPLELAELAQAFTEMAQQTAHMQETLEEEVRIRTAALEASEERYRLLSEIAPVPIGLHDGDTVLYANDAAAKLFRAQSKEDLVGRPIADLLHPEELPDVIERMDRLRAGESVSFPVVYRMRRLDGTEFLSELTSVPMKAEAGMLFQVVLRPVVGGLGSHNIQRVFYQLAQGILAGRSIEELIWQLYEGCRQVLPLDTFYLAIVDHGVQTYTMPLFIQRGENLGAFTRQLGAESLTAYVVQTRRPLLIRDSSDPSQLPATPERIAFPPEKLCYMAVPLIHEERVLGVLSAQNFTPNAYGEEEVDILNQLGQQIALALVHSEQLQAIRTQASRMQRILDTAPGGLLMLDSSHRVTLANPTARALLKRLAAFTPDQRLTHLANEPLTDLLPRAAASGSPVTLQQQDPDPLIVEVASRPLTLLGGDKGWVLSLHDVTQLWEQERRLQQQERLATMGQLAAGIAHDFNNILAVITLYSQMLQANPDLPRRKHYLATIHEQSEHAARLIAQILDFSRKSVIERTVFDLGDLLQETVLLLERTLPENIRLDLDLPPGDAYVHADRGRIQQVFMNLAVNARDAMSNGGRIRVQIDTVHTTEPTVLSGKGASTHLPAGAWARIRVADTGPGIAPEHLDHIFNPFFTTKPPGEGTGLGLAQVYGIIKQHGGEVVVESPPGQGAIFTVFLPLSEEIAGAARPLPG